MYVEVNAKEALNAYAKGRRVICLERDDDIDGTVNSFTLARLLKGFAFLVDVPDPVKVPTEGAGEKEDAPVLPPPKPEKSGETQSGKTGKGAKVDIGKILALYNAG